MGDMYKEGIQPREKRKEMSRGFDDKNEKLEPSSDQPRTREICGTLD